MRSIFLLLLLFATTISYTAPKKETKMNEIDEYILEAIHLSVWGGFDSPEDVDQIVSDILEDGANEKMLREAIHLEFEKKNKDEKTWPKITDFDRLDTVFSKLKKQGILCLHNAGVTKQDGHDDAHEELKKHPKKQFYGYCYYHRQDLDRAVTGHGLMLGYDHVKGDVPEKNNVAETIKRELQNVGFDIEWNGSTETRINIPKIDWKHRYSE